MLTETDLKNMAEVKELLGEEGKQLSTNDIYYLADKAAQWVGLSVDIAFYQWKGFLKRGYPTNSLDWFFKKQVELFIKDQRDSPAGDEV